MMVTTNKRASDVDQGRMLFVKNLSLEGILALITAAGGLVYSFAFLTADVHENTKETAALKDWVSHHVQTDETKNDKTQEKLDAIKEELDQLVGRVDGRYSAKKGGG